MSHYTVKIKSESSTVEFFFNDLDAAEEFFHIMDMEIYAQNVWIGNFIYENDEQLDSNQRDDVNFQPSCHQLK